MDNGILTSIKNQLSVAIEDEAFDAELVIFINAAFSILTQLGVGPVEGFRISGYDETWDDFVVDIVQEDMAKTYVYLKVKTLFDPPANTSLANAINEQIREYEYRLKLQAEV